MKRSNFLRIGMKYAVSLFFVATLVSFVPAFAHADSHHKKSGSTSDANHQGDGTNNGGDGSGSPVSVPEVPYAAILPIGIIGFTVLAYRKKMKTQ